MSASTKAPRTLLLMAALAICILAFSLAHPGTANAWLSPGATYAYPEQGGTWKYGFWNAKVRSLYFLNTRSHGSSVMLNGVLKRSLCTAPGYWSNADKWARQGPRQDDRYFYRLC